MDRGGRDRPPHFLKLGRCSTSPWPANSGWQFDPRLLEACVAQPVAWKRQHGFPEDVVQVLRLGAPQSAEEPWRRVIVDRPESLAAVLVLAPTPQGDRLLGFTACPEKWTLEADELVFTLADGWAEVIPELAEEPSPEAWQAAWQEWCDGRHLPAGDMEPGGLQPAGLHLRVRPRAEFAEKLRKRADLLKSEAWVLAGTGRLRRAALIEVAAISTEPPT